MICVERPADRKHCLHLVVIYFAFVRTLWFRKSFCTLWTPLALKCTFNWKSGSMFWLFFVRNDESDSERNGSTWCRALRHVVLLIAITRHFLKPCDKNWATASSNSQWCFYHSSDFDSKSCCGSYTSPKILILGGGKANVLKPEQNTAKQKAQSCKSPRHPRPPPCILGTPLTSIS